MKRMKRTVSILLCTAFLLSAAACQGTPGGEPSGEMQQTGTSQAESGKTAQPLKIKHLSSVAVNNPITAARIDIFNEYAETHPGFEYEYECISDKSAYLQKVKILASSDELPMWFDADAEPFFEQLVKKDIGLMDFDGQYGFKNWDATFAAITLTILPILLVYYTFNKHVIEGMAAGAMKE